MLWQWPKKVSKKKMAEMEKIFRFSIFLELPRRGQRGRKIYSQYFWSHPEENNEASILHGKNEKFIPICCPVVVP